CAAPYPAVFLSRCPCACSLPDLARLPTPLSLQLRVPLWLVESSPAVFVYWPPIPEAHPRFCPLRITHLLRGRFVPPHQTSDPLPPSGRVRLSSALHS